MWVTVVIKAKQTGQFYVAFWHFTTLPIKLQRFVKLSYAVIAHIAFHAYLTTYFLLFYANFQRFISKGWHSNVKQITVLSKGKAFNFYEPIACLGMFILFTKNYLNTSKNTLFQDIRSNIDS